ncbi:MAG: transcriptional repressor [Clostridia bacterium]|nr:transcriptional repressor [Clostridia bacterium]
MQYQEIAKMLSSRGIRPTQQRLAVYDYLLQHRTHPSADTIYGALIEQNPTFSRTTVYNSLHTLVQAALVKELTMDTEERHYDADIRPHGHFHCRQCGEIADIRLDGDLLQALRPAGYTVQEQEVYFSGLCPACGEATGK